MRHLEDDDDIVCFFPEEKEIGVGTVVKHKRYPDTTVGFVTKVKVDPPNSMGRSESWDTDISGTILPDTHRYIDQHEVEWSSPPDRRDLFTTGSIVGFGRLKPLSWPANSFFTTGSLVRLK